MVVKDIQAGSCKIKPLKCDLPYLSSTYNNLQCEHLTPDCPCNKYTFIRCKCKLNDKLANYEAQQAEESEKLDYLYEKASETLTQIYNKANLTERKQ